MCSECASPCLPTPPCLQLWRPEDIRAPRAGSTGGSELLDVGAGTEPGPVKTMKPFLWPLKKNFLNIVVFLVCAHKYRRLTRAADSC